MFVANVERDYEFAPESSEEVLELLAGPARVDHLRTSSENIFIDEGGAVVTSYGALSVTAPFLSQIYKVLGLSKKEVQELPPEALSEKFSQWTTQYRGPVAIAHVGEVATGFIEGAESTYQPASSFQVFGALIESGLVDAMELRRASVSYRGSEFAYIQKELAIEPTEVGDTIEVGFIVTNSSENGGRALQAEAFSERLLCKNGSRISEIVGVVRYQNEPRLSQEACTENFIHDLAKLVKKLPQISQVYQDVEKLIPNVELNRLWCRVVRYGFTNAQADGILGLSEVDRLELQEKLGSRSASVQESLSDLNVHVVHNRITFAAHSARFMGRRVLEELGGQFLVDAMRWPPTFSSN